MATTLNQTTSNLGTIIESHKDTILAEWIREMGGSVRRSDLMKDAELQSQCNRFLGLLAEATSSGNANGQSENFAPLREMLTDISSSRALQGFTSRDTASFVFSIKRPLFSAIQKELSKDPVAMAREMMNASEFLDSLGLHTTDAYLKAREQTILRQQQEMMELSTPVVKLWEGILALPLIGTLDSARTQVVMESLLAAIVRTNSQVAIIDITGVPTVDTVVAQHLLKTVTAARLMGADCIISGVRPQIAQTIVHLGINLLDVTTKATLSDAFGLALKKSGFTFVRSLKNQAGEQQ
jgi:rsbT co-antagonist protein RsbR